MAMVCVPLYQHPGHPPKPEPCSQPAAPLLTNPPLQAMNRMAMVCVPLYDTLGDAAVQYIVKHAGTRLVVASGQKLGVVAKALQGEGKGECGERG